MCLDIVSTRKRSRLGLVSDTRGSRLGLVSDSLANVSVSSRSRELRSRSWSRSRPRRSWAHPWLYCSYYCAYRCVVEFVSGKSTRDLFVIKFIMLARTFQFIFTFCRVCSFSSNIPWFCSCTARPPICYALESRLDSFESCKI